MSPQHSTPPRPDSDRQRTSHSTPLRPSSGHVNSDDFSSKGVPQETLKRMMGQELGNHTWQFPFNTFSQMVCHRERKPAADITRLRMGRDDGVDRLEYYHHDSDGDWFASAVDAAANNFEVKLAGKNAKLFPNTSSESVHYTPLALLLNHCLDACAAASKGTNFDLARSGPYSKLSFVVYDKPTGDGIEAAASLKPDLVGGEDFLAKVNSHNVLYWSPPDPPDPLNPYPPILIPVEIKNNWPELVRQAATYARCLFSARPLRKTALVLGYNHVTKEFRFLLFHRGGLTASHVLHPRTLDGRKQMVHVFLALLTCRNISDTGFPDWCNDNQFKLPVDKDGTRHVIADIDKVLHYVNCCRGRAARVSLVTYPLLGDPPAPRRKREGPLVPDTEVRRSARIAAAQEPKATVGVAGGIGPAVTSPIRYDDKKTKKGKKPVPIGIHDGEYPPLQGVTIDPANMHYSSPLGEGVAATNGRFTGVLKTSWQQDQEMILEQELLTVCNGLFGTPRHHYSFRPANADQVPITNHLFLPSPEQAKGLQSFHWDLMSMGTPSAPEYKSLWVHFCSLVGMSLVLSKDPLLLFEAILHGMLGWLSMFLKGFLHRDVSIGNLLALQDAIEMEPFKIDSSDELSTLVHGLNIEGLPNLNLVDQARRLERLIGELDIGNKCSGFIIDGDHAARWEQSFGSPHDGTRSGTAEFMSNRLLDSIVHGRPYLQSPLDDIQSFYYVAQWAAAFHKDGDKFDDVKDIRSGLSGNVEARALVSDRIRTLAASDANYVGAFLVRCRPLLHAWYSRFTDLSIDFADARDASGEESWLKIVFQTFAYRGVADFLEVFQRHKESLANSRN
ncbi:hypothetical protein GGX14DRAFT_624497 [Mycena pura]|uniref:Fungal-type protein kinase domain-containing protein n=1 Tax=Mycena pura TaxID=153505 RepID=A0AAD6YDZ0_9AGAR|nr:hypothetical protein GGX14DRAFT_624497 [Mycena pura]